jgi:hypothetical protein
VVVDGYVVECPLGLWRDGILASLSFAVFPIYSPRTDGLMGLGILPVLLLTACRLCGYVVEDRRDEVVVESEIDG